MAMTTPEAGAPIEWTETNGAVRHLRKCWGPATEGPFAKQESYPAEAADLDAAGYISKAEASRLLNDLQQAHVRELAKAAEGEVVSGSSAPPRCRATAKNGAGSVVQCVHPRNHLGIHEGLGKAWPNQGEDYNGWADQPTEPQPPAGSKDSSPDPCGKTLPGSDALGYAACGLRAGHQGPCVELKRGDHAGGGEERVTAALEGTIKALADGLPSDAEMCDNALNTLDKVCAERDALRAEVAELKQKLSEWSSRAGDHAGEAELLKAEVAELKAERDHLAQAAELLRRCERSGEPGHKPTFDLLTIHADMCAWAARDKQSPSSANPEPWAPHGPTTASGSRVRINLPGSDNHGALGHIAEKGTSEEYAWRVHFDHRERNDGDVWFRTEHLDPVTQPTSGRPGRDRPVSAWLSRSWNHHEESRKKRGIIDGSQLTEDDHAFIELWHAVRELEGKVGQ